MANHEQGRFWLSLDGLPNISTIALYRMEQKTRYYRYFLDACSILKVRKDVLGYRIRMLNTGSMLAIKSRDKAGELNYILKLFGTEEIDYGRMHIIGIFRDGELIFKAPVLLKMPKKMSKCPVTRK